MARAKKDQTEATPDTDVVQEAEAAAADAAVAVETEPAAEPQAPTVDADTVAAAEPPIEFVVVKTRHGAPYRRCWAYLDLSQAWPQDKGDKLNSLTELADWVAQHIANAQEA